MRNLTLLLFTVFLFTSCGKDPEGVWQNDKAENNKLVVLKNEKGISLRGINDRRWSNYISIGGDEYMSKSDPRKFKFLSGDKMQFTQPSKKEPYVFSKVVLPGDLTLIHKLMTREQVRKFIGEPKEIYTEKLAEKWLYESGLLLTFDKDSVFKIENK